jgi:hypothetical protein
MFRTLATFFRRLKMGGENEQVVPKSSPATPAVGDQLSGNLRIHTDTNNGEIHFHDDAAKIKAAVPASLWYRVWDDLRSLQMRVWEFVDPQGESILKVTMNVVDNVGVPSTVESHIELRKVVTNDTFKLLDKASRRS